MSNRAVISSIAFSTASNFRKRIRPKHCGSVQYDSDTSVTIGWGLHGVIDNIPPIPQAAQTDANYPDIPLYQGSRPIFTDYNLEDGTISFELTAHRNAKASTSEALFSYRTYKNAD